jgi:hypothetical protein
MRYQISNALPHFVNRWVLMRKDAVLEPLYHFESTNDSDEGRIANLRQNDLRRLEMRKNNNSSKEHEERVKQVDSES